MKFLKATITVAAVAVAAGAWAMLDDDAALKAARATLAKMTLEEKTLLLGGSGTMTLSAIPRVGITKEWTMSDNSSTVRPAMSRWGWDYEQPKSENTKLPALSALAQTWDPTWARKHGEVLGAEMRDRGVDELLGPGVNILRTPLNGRNWEYLGEDPCLAATMCVPIIQGVQSYDVAATVKHYCLNSQEWERFTVDTHVDLRTLNEIYLPAFRAAVKGGVLCVMSSYNKIDGIWASENKYTQTAILRDRWGFKGLIETDWGGQHSTEFAANNGGGVEMHWGQGINFFYNPKEKKFPLAEAVRANKVPAATVDDMALRVLYVMAKTGFLTGAPRKAGARNTPEHQKIARAEAADSIVLLKNEDGVLPLGKKGAIKSILVIGKNAAEKQCHKGCSGEGNVPYEVTLFDALKELKDVQVTLMPFCEEVKLETTDTSAAAIAGGHAEQKTTAEFCTEAELKAAAEKADVILVFTGTELGYQENMESESRDRVSMNLPPAMEKAMHTILDWKLPNTVVISRSGTPVGYTWTEKARTMIQFSFLGMEEGHAVRDVLFGAVTPSGKLCQSWPKSYADTPVAQCGTYNPTNVIYNERFYVGYRWFDKKGIEPLFPFGFGLSYTTFAYANVRAEELTVKVDVTNTGLVAGKEVVQVYASYPGAKVERCVKELKGFQKVSLAPGETKTVEIPLTARDLAYWDEFTHRFTTPAGTYELLVGSSSRDIRARTSVQIGETAVFCD